MGVGAGGSPGTPEAGAGPPGTQEEGRAPEHTLGGPLPPRPPREPWNVLAPTADTCQQEIRLLLTSKTSLGGGEAARGPTPERGTTRSQTGFPALPLLKPFNTFPRLGMTGAPRSPRPGEVGPLPAPSASSPAPGPFL